jgi:hypothetical protein
MTALSTVFSTVFGTPLGIAGFLCGVAIFFVVMMRTLKKRTKI